MTPNLLDELEALAMAWDAKAERARDDAEYAKAGAFEDCADDLREKAPALADMAKRMEAAERDAGKCWALHFKGPDDVVAVPSREAAEIAARNFNAFWDAYKHQRDHDVRAVAEVIEWEHGAVEHAKSAAEHWPEYAALLTAAIDATQEGAG